MKRLMTLAVAFAAAMMAIAETEKVGGYTWRYRINGDTAEIYGYRDGSGAFNSAIWPRPSSTVTIPSTLGGKPVTSIGNYAFAWCSDLTSMTIPDGVTSIESYVFSGCTKLTSVTIPDSVTSIGDFAFEGCSGLYRMTIPDSVTSIGYLAFKSCSDSLFDTTTIPGVKLKGGWAVGNTGSLSGVLDLTGVCGIGGGAFEGCGLASVTIPDSVMLIGNSAFASCTNLTSVTIPNSVTLIGNSAFASCTNLTSVTIPNNVTSIGNLAFYNCSGLMSVTISDSVTNIGMSAFSGCSGLTNVTMGIGVTNIGGNAFYGCSGLTNVTIPDSVTSIGSSAFYACRSLDSVAIPVSVRHIGDDAFVWTPYDAAIQAKMSKIIAESDGKGYSLVDGSRAAEDRTIASVTVDGDCAIDGFVLKDGMVYDSVLRIVNTAPNEVKVTLPSGYVYETIGTASPLVLPASSKSLLTITRTADRTFLVTRQTLNVIQ